MARDTVRMDPQPGQDPASVAASGLRRWTDIILAISLLVMTLSGAGLLAWHDAPQAEAAKGSFLGVPFDVWSHVHLVSSLAFAAAAASHIRLNWKPLLRHFRQRQSARRPTSSRH